MTRDVKGPVGIIFDIVLWGFRIPGSRNHAGVPKKTTLGTLRDSKS